jgi:DNA-binding beta-propeller fold protein YncE
MLVSVERVVEDFEPPAHAQAGAEAHGRAAIARNQFLTYAYGRPSVIYSPRHVATDSHHRLVISDPSGNAVHVLDPAGKTSFRITCGANRRLRQPQGVAVDSHDHIYVADSERGFVLVFDGSGNYVRDIGNPHGEPDYASPHGIAIDQGASRLYLSDTPRNLVIVSDLEGHVLKQLGKLHDGSGEGEFDHPTDIAINHKHVFVLDRRGTRVQVLDMAFHPVGSFDLNRGLNLHQEGENGLGADRDGNVYISWSDNGRVWVFTDAGRLLGSFGQPGIRAGEFVGPGGLWIDSSNRLYVADSGNGRVQMFQLSSPQ